jgi:hypothetical protein
MEGGSLDGVARSKRELIARKELAVKIDRKERAKTEYQQARRCVVIRKNYCFVAMFRLDQSNLQDE